MKVYLIGNTQFGFCKIGVSTDVPWRLKTLDSPRLPFVLEVLAEYDAGPDAYYVESQLHRFFKERQTRGEWFDSIQPKAFLHEAKVAHKKYIPKPKRKYIDPLAGSRWRSHTDAERVDILLSLKDMPLAEAKALMAEEEKVPHAENGAPKQDQRQPMAQPQA